MWKYNRKTKMIECYYPVSSYDSGFYTAYNLESAKYQMNDVWCDYKEGGLTLKFENNNTSEDEKKSIKEIAIEKIMEMDDDEIISRLLL